MSFLCEVLLLMFACLFDSILPFRVNRLLIAMSGKHHRGFLFRDLVMLFLVLFFVLPLFSLMIFSTIPTLVSFNPLASSLPAFSAAISLHVAFLYVTFFLPHLQPLPLPHHSLL
jgi:hypothetical protein